MRLAYKIGNIGTGAIFGCLLALAVKWAGVPWWHVLMMLVCALVPSVIIFTVDGPHISELRKRLALSVWKKLAVVLLLVAIILVLIRINGINPRDYAYVPLLLPVIASAILFGFGQGLFAVVACTLIGDYLFAPPEYNFMIWETQDAISLAVFAVLGAAVVWLSDHLLSFGEP